MNVFTKSNDATPKPNRNTFDGSFVNNLTLKMGQITPCFLKEVIPGDSFKIDATFGFNFQPFVFPVQTDMQANLHFFYVRNRALWNGWQDFITKTENLEGDSTPPYIQLTDSNRDMFETGNIGDYLGVPSVYYSNSPLTRAEYAFNNPDGLYDFSPVDKLFGTVYLSLYTDETINDNTTGGGSEITNWLKNDFTDERMKNYASVFQRGVTSYDFSALSNSRNIRYTPMMYGKLKPGLNLLSLPLNVLLQGLGELATQFDEEVTTKNTCGGFALYDRKLNKVVAAIKIGFKVTSSSVVRFTASMGNDSFSGYVLSDNVEYVGSNNPQFIINVPSESVDHELEMFYFNPYSDVGSYASVQLAGRSNSFQYYFADGIIPNADRPLGELPFASSANLDGIRISALPFRAVEACYNAFYRDDRNNPLIIDGKPYYNVYVQNKQGGADTTHYHLYQRNWESDVFTSAVQSPQQGVAPLVGVTASGQMTFADEEGKTYYLQAEFGEDGHTITGIKSYSSDMPVGTLRAMVDTISTGISINDFRNVNALQRWLETNMRKGLRYKDQIEAHFGTAPTYSELDMPEFIGGMSRRVEVNKVVQTSADTPESPMGTLAGNATILGGNGQSVTQYCDEHGWIIGFITITPKPVYSQQLNKQLLKTELLDYYFPEFAHIGFQPILNQEIAPLQCTDSEGNRLTDVFGYQRAWYEYLANVDEVHGDFRTTLKDYIIHRVFDGVPKLGVDFLTVSTDEANEVFAVQDDSDKIFGQIYFDVKMKRPLPAIGVPKLEVG